MVNTVVPLEKLEEETLRWWFEILKNSSTAISCLKAVLNAGCDGQTGIQQLAGYTTMLFYQTKKHRKEETHFCKKENLILRRKAEDIFKS